MTGDLFPGVGDSNTAVDNLAGTAGQDEYHGGASNDNLSTGAENDLVSGDAGDDAVATGAGDDTITFSGTGEGFDAVTGGAGVDTILALADDTDIGMRSISTVEKIDANGHTGVRILGSTGNDVLNFTNVTLTGIVSIDGGGGNDALTGSAAADVIIGRGGTDMLNGGSGNDTIEGGAGNDTLNGGIGNDIFRYLLGGFGNDTITGFDANPSGGQDTIDLAGLGITAANFAAKVTITNAGGGAALITIAGQGTIRLTGVAVSAVTSPTSCWRNDQSASWVAGAPAPMAWRRLGWCAGLAVGDCRDKCTPRPDRVRRVMPPHRGHHPFLPRSLGSGALDGGEDLDVAGATTQVAGEPDADLLLGRRGVAAQQRGGRHDHSRGAEPTLHATLVEQGLLQRMQLVADHHAFDGRDRSVGCLGGEVRARVDRLAVDQHHARAALAVVAALLGAGQTDLGAQHADEVAAGVDGHRVVDAVDVEVDRDVHDAAPMPRLRLTGTAIDSPRARRAAASTARRAITPMQCRR